jgi:hypothetical protein
VGTARRVHPKVSIQEAGVWKVIPASALPEWNEHLLRTNAHLYQYPYWNEPLRRIRFKPQYLVYENAGESQAYAALLRIGFPLFRIGLVRGGPVSLLPDREMPPSAIHALRRWARQHGYIFLRFSHTSARVLHEITSTSKTDSADAFPFYPHQEYDLVVNQLPDENAALSSFQRVARRNIRDAREQGYEVRVTDAPEALTESWPLFEALSRRKQTAIYSRPLGSYLDLVQLGRPHGCVRLYMAYLKSRLVESIVVVRNRDSAFYVAGALDVEGLERTTASPSCLLHWTAMRDFAALGANVYSLGITSSPFKEKFRPVRVDFPQPVTMVLRPVEYTAWSRTLPLMARYGAKLRAVASKLSDSSSTG